MRQLVLLAVIVGSVPCIAKSMMRGNYRYGSDSNRETRDGSGSNRGTRGDCVNDPREVSCDAFFSYDRNSCVGEHMKQRFTAS